MIIDPSRLAERRARIESLVAEYQAVKQRRLLRLAMRLWRRAQDRQRLVAPETPLERVH
jgi:hypothetical protein